MWIVWSYDEGLICETDNKEKATEHYEYAKKGYIEGFDGEFNGVERVYLAKVEKHFCSEDTGEFAFEENENGKEVNTGDTYWMWKEESIN